MGILVALYLFAVNLFNRLSFSPPNKDTECILNGNASCVRMGFMLEANAEKIVFVGSELA